MFPICAVHIIDFRDVVNEREVTHGEALVPSVDAVLGDPPYNLRRGRRDDNSGYDLLSFTDMADVVDVCKRMMKPGAHGHLFCSTLQFGQWFKVLSKEVEDEVSDGVESKADLKEKEGAPKKRVLDAEAVLLHCTRAVGNFLTGLDSWKVNHVCICEKAVHFWRKGSSYADKLSHIYYESHGDVPTTHPWWTNEMNEIPRLTPAEKRYATDTSDDGEKRSRILRSEQKSLGLMKDIVSKFSKTGELVVDLFSGTFATAKACLELPEHSRFVGCEIDGHCFRASTESLVEIYARQVLNDESNITAEEEVVEVCMVVVRGLEAVRDRKLVRVWAVPAGLSAVQAFPLHVMYFASNLYCDPSLFERAREVPLTQWYPTWRASFHALKAEMLLAMECSGMVVALKKSSIQHPNAGHGVFAARPTGMGTVAGYYYGSLVCEDLSAAGSRHTTYGENVIEVMKAKFSNWAARLPETATDRNMVEHPVWIVRAPFLRDALRER